MDKKQKINCKVKSCAYNDTQKNSCELNKITVEPCANGNNGNPEDESMCGSYKHIK